MVRLYVHMIKKYLPFNYLLVWIAFVLTYVDVWKLFRIRMTSCALKKYISLKHSCKKSCSNLLWRRVIIFKHYSFLSPQKILLTCEREKEKCSAKELNYCSMFTDRESSIKSSWCNADTENYYDLKNGYQVGSKEVFCYLLTSSLLKVTQPPVNSRNVFSVFVWMYVFLYFSGSKS